MNVQLIDSLIQVILSLSTDEQLAIVEKLLANIPYPSTQELAQLAQRGGCLDFLHDEPDLYTLEDR
ncbi:MAG: homeobox domain-containing protein [Richelia sp. CSU_2_1]|nr:homeobox domain-containing protein [Microcoleus sp. SU_5_6]NJL66758.1 homeobox domain-containing protein [Microcoleus sp. SM1_3_4]NJR22410.1 homeobox domain-containing protein [Richelia sp. CSU_2_1]